MAKGQQAPEQKAPAQPPAPPAPEGQKGEAEGKGGGEPKAAETQPKADPQPPEPKPEPKPKSTARAAAPKAEEPKRPNRPGLVELIARETCAAHGNMHFAGDRFSATHEVADRLLRRKLVERA